MRASSKIALLGVAALTVVLPISADAMRRGGSNAVPEQQAKLRAEWAQARRAGGYSDPFSALARLIAGETVEPDVQPVISDPKRETIWELSK